MTAANEMPEEKNELLYGQVENGLVFIPKHRAEELIAIQEAIHAAKTWGEFWALLPHQAREEYADLLRSDYRTLDEYLAEERKFDPEISELDARTEWEASDRRLPLDSDPYSFGEAPYIQEGDWPGWPAQEMASWVPRDIQKRFGTTGMSAVSGNFLELQPRDAAAICAAFASLGYRCQRDDAAVNQASGL